MSKLSVIIPTYNRKNSLLRTLKALENQTQPKDSFEVVVISDGSSDGTAEAVQACHFSYRLRFVEQKNQGPSVARNHGARLAVSNLLVYVDDDIEPIPEFLQEHYETQKDQTHLVVIGPQSGPENEAMDHWIAWEHMMLKKQYVNFEKGIWQAGPNNLYSGNFSLLREHLLKVGGFNEQFTRQEDVELGFRLANIGLKFTFNPRANGIHRPTRTFESWFKTPFEYGRRDVQMARDGGEDRVIELTRKHFKERSGVTRALATVCIGNPVLENAVMGFAKTLVKVGGRKIALASCSLLFNLRYLQGMCKELGGRQRLWETLKGA